MRVVIWVLLICFVSSINNVFYTSCNESTTRTCTYADNVTAKLLDFKKGGSDILSTSDYQPTFFNC